jgi:uncharacterized phosphosugar-binding protein
VNKALCYYEAVERTLQKIASTQAERISEAALLIADTVARDGVVYTLGSGHSLVVAAELYYRAGGMACFDVIHDRTFGRAEHLSGYAKVLLDSYPIGSKDLLIIVSNSGRNALPIEAALEGRDRRIKTIAITSVAHSKAVSSRHGSGLQLFAVCDVVIDNCGVIGDAAVALGQDGINVGPTSTVAGIFIANSMVCLAAEELARRDMEVPILRSNNLDGSDACNARWLDFMRSRIRGL